MAAVAAYLGYVLIGRVPAVIAAVLLLSADRARTSFVPASVIVRHKFVSRVRARFCRLTPKVPFRIETSALQQYQNYMRGAPRSQQKVERAGIEGRLGVWLQKTDSQRFHAYVRG